MAGPGAPRLPRGTAGPAHPPGGGPGHLEAVRAGAGLEEFHAAARAREPDLDADVADRNRAQNVAGEAGDHHFCPRLAALHGPAEQRARRPAMLGAGVPGAGGVRCCPPHAIAQRYVEAVGHATNVTGQSREPPCRAGLPADHDHRVRSPRQSPLPAQPGSPRIRIACLPRSASGAVVAVLVPITEYQQLREAAEEAPPVSSTSPLLPAPARPWPSG